eukprot:scaffold76841_cov69-Phaeocystis_antarctica.AAC.6
MIATPAADAAPRRPRRRQTKLTLSCRRHRPRATLGGPTGRLLLPGAPCERGNSVECAHAVRRHLKTDRGTQRTQQRSRRQAPWRRSWGSRRRQ